MTSRSSCYDGRHRPSSVRSGTMNNGEERTMHRRIIVAVFAVCLTVAGSAAADINIHQDGTLLVMIAILLRFPHSLRQSDNRTDKNSHLGLSFS